MLIIIHIIDKYSGHSVAAQWVKIEPPYDFLEEDCYNEAWNKASANGRVKRHNRSDYQFIVADRILAYPSPY